MGTWDQEHGLASISGLNCFAASNSVSYPLITRESL